MRLLTRLEERFGRFALPNLTLALIICQMTVYLVTGSMNQKRDMEIDGPAEEVLMLIPAKVMAGEVWRLVTFLFLPPTMGLLGSLLFWYAFYIFGTALESYWGTFRYNLYLFIGTVAIAAVSFLTPALPASNLFLDVTVFLAVAWIAPEMPILLFFILPVPIKWIARLTWAGLLLAFFLGDWSIRAQSAASVANFLLFFGREIIEHVRHGHRTMTRQAARLAVERPRPEHYHRCVVCGITDRSHPGTEFRYCSKCVGDCCYCGEHLRAHTHRTA